MYRTRGVVHNARTRARGLALYAKVTGFAARRAATVLFSPGLWASKLQVFLLSGTIRRVHLAPFGSPRESFWCSWAQVWWLWELRGRGLDSFGGFWGMGPIFEVLRPTFLPLLEVLFGIPNLKSRKNITKSFQKAVLKKCCPRTSSKRKMLILLYNYFVFGAVRHVQIMDPLVSRWRPSGIVIPHL